MCQCGLLSGARVPSTSVAVNCVFLFTAGASQIIIETKSLLLFVSLIPRLQIVMGMEIDFLFLYFALQVAHSTLIDAYCE